MRAFIILAAFSALASAQNEIPTATTLPPSGAATGVLNGNYPGPGLNVGCGATASATTVTVAAVCQTIANSSSTGTTLNTLTKLAGAPSTAVISSAGDTSSAIGIVDSGAGTTGSAVIQENGQHACVFDGATTAGHYVSISASVAGNCTDAGATFPTKGQVIGQVLSTNVGAGTYVVDMSLKQVSAPPCPTIGLIFLNTAASTPGCDALLFWDNTNKALDIGNTNAAGFSLDVGSGSSTVKGKMRLNDNQDNQSITFANSGTSRGAIIESGGAMNFNQTLAAVTPNSYLFQQTTAGGHIAVHTNSQAVVSGTGCTRVSANDTIGSVTLSAGAATCTVTFASNTYVAPQVFLMPSTNAILPLVTATAAGSFSFSVATASGTVTYLVLDLE